MRRNFAMPVLLAACVAGVFGQEPSHDRLLYNPYERAKNGPPLDNVFHKVRSSWLFKKLREARHHRSARMANFQFTEEEVLDLMAYLKSIAEQIPPSTTVWPAWAAKGFKEMDYDEIEAMFEQFDRGKAVWANARCTICHVINGPGGSLIGGFVDLRVGGIDLQIAATKLRRDWLYDWLRDPKDYFPTTLMPRFRLTEEQIRALVEYILRDDAFLPSTEEKEETETGRWAVLDQADRVTRGKRLIELSRCVVCHQVRGIDEIMPLPVEIQRPEAGAGLEFLMYDLRCLSCHSLDGRGGTYAPDLTSEGSRLQQRWILGFLQSPDMIRPLSQQMPKLNLTAQEASILATYLVQRQDHRMPSSIPGGGVTSNDIERGRKLFSARGCFSCHTTSEGVGGVVGPDLADVGNRLKSGYIWFHLKHPHEVNRYTAEPDYGLTDEEARAVAAYLSTRKQ